MSVLRAILARFARLLVRIARTLDPGVAAAPYWAVPERMAMLRQRYPGAPEHWLELVARRAQIGPAREPQAPAEREAPPTETAEARPAPPGAIFFKSLFRRRERPAMQFAQPRARPRPPLGTGTSAKRVQQPALPLPAAPAPSERPRLSFDAPRGRNPIANLVRNDRRARRPAMLRFDANPHAPREIPQPEHSDDARSEHPAIFPDTGARGRRGDELIGPEPAPRLHAADARWPEFRHPPLVEASWPGQQRRSARRDPAFAATDPRWPELPALAAEIGPAPALTRDEAALLAEQIGGTWSE